MAVAVAVAVSGGVAVPVAGLTKRFCSSHPKRFLNQCLGLAFKSTDEDHGDSHGDNNDNGDNSNSIFWFVMNASL